MTRSGIRITIVSLALITAAAAAPRPVETPRLEEESTPGAAAPSAGPFAEPAHRPDAEADAILSAYHGEPFDDPPASAAVARAMARVRAEAAPGDEVFAMITVTDRHTGERRFLTRGTPSPEVALALHDPALGPRGVLYDEQENAVADEETETVVRSVHARAGVTYRKPDRDREEKRGLKKRNRGGGLSYRIDGDLRAAITSGQIDVASDALVSVNFRLAKVPRLSLPKERGSVMDGLLWVGLDVQAAREAAIIERKQAMAALQARLVARIAQLGGTVRYASWTAGSMIATVPANALRQLAARPEVLSMDLRTPGTADDSYQGDDIFAATDSENFDLNHSGDSGPPAGRHASIGSNVVIGQSEECIHTASPAWLDWAGGPSRLVTWECDNILCTQANYVDCIDRPHGNGVAGMMVADFMDGQDAFVSSPDDRIMTGTCPECSLLFVQDTDNDQKEESMDLLCDEEVDIYESSISHGQSCDGNGFLDASVEALADCDVVTVKSASNDGSTGGCTTNYPADHPWTFAVGGMTSKDACNTAADYYTADCPYSASASKGGAEYNGNGGITASIVDLTAPYNLGGVLSPGTANPVTYKNGGGTSYSAPIVAGLMAELMDWYSTHVSDALFFENRARNFMLLMGDRSVDSAGTARAINFYDDFWGGGRVGLVPFDDKGTWSVHRGACTLSGGSSCVFTLNVPAGATFLKASVWHDGTDYDDEPMIQLDLTPVNCGTAAQSTARRDSKAMLVYTPTFNPLNGCTRVDATVTNVVDTLSVQRKVHFAAYTDTEDERHF